MGGADVIENSEILADGMIAAAAFLLLREVERRMEGGENNNRLGGQTSLEGDLQQKNTAVQIHEALCLLTQEISELTKCTNSLKLTEIC